jgi:nitric oxide reductase activation protein
MRAKVLIALSHGKPNDHDHEHRPSMTSRTPVRRCTRRVAGGVHAFRIAVDEEAHEYLPYMCGAARYAVIDDFGKGRSRCRPSHAS